MYGLLHSIKLIHINKYKECGMKLCVAKASELIYDR